MSDELQQLVTLVMDHAISAHHRADAQPGETTAEAHALTSLALAGAYLLESERIREAQEDLEKSARVGLCYEHQEDLLMAARGSCRVDGCEERARR